jgi:hypothetical protein
MKNNASGFFSSSISASQVKDSGMAFVLILLIIGLIIENNIFFFIAAGSLLMNMIFPKFFFPFAFIWLGFSAILGSITSKIILLMIYLVVVLPVALVRKLMGKDTLLLRNFKKDKGSVLMTRNHLFQAEDLEKPF